MAFSLDTVHLNLRTIVINRQHLTPILGFVLIYSVSLLRADEPINILWLANLSD